MEIVNCRFCLQKFSVEKSGEYACPHCRQRQMVSLAARPFPQKSASREDPLDTTIAEMVSPSAGVHLGGGERPSPSAPEIQRAIAWERREELGFWGALKDTCMEVLKSPTQFFRTLSPHGEVGDSLLFGVTVGSIGAWFAFLWQVPVQFLTKQNHSPELPMLPGFGSLQGAWWGILALFVPLFSAIGILVSSAVLHFFLTLFQGRKFGYAATLRLCAFAQVPVLFQIVPCGGLISGIYTTVLLVIGLREVHETSTGKAVAVLLTPLLVCCCLPMGIWAGLMVHVFQKVMQISLI